MAPILGIWASSALPAATAGSFESIATVTVGSGGSSSVTFSSIPGTYTHLQLRGIGRTARTGSYNDALYVYFNTDTGSQTNYSAHILYGDGSTAQAQGNTSNSGITTVAASDCTSGVFSGFVIDILDYSNTNKYKTVRTLAGFDNNGQGQIRLGSTLWRNTAAITDLKLDNSVVNNISQYSSFALYGIRS